VYASDAPHVDPAVFEIGVPVMGICYGLQEIARTHGGQVEAHTHREYGYAKIQVEKTGHAHADALFEGIEMEEDGGLQVGFSLWGVFQLEEVELIWVGLDVPRRPAHIPPPSLRNHRLHANLPLHFHRA
jgi:hypothetical protein